jgi:hypothetical protein
MACLGAMMIDVVTPNKYLISSTGSQGAPVGISSPSTAKSWVLPSAFTVVLNLTRLGVPRVDLYVQSLAQPTISELKPTLPRSTMRFRQQDMNSSPTAGPIKGTHLTISAKPCSTTARACGSHLAARFLTPVRLPDGTDLMGR